MDKSWYKSTEVLAGIVVVAGVIAKLFGYDVPIEAILGLLGYSLIKGRVSRKQ